MAKVVNGEVLRLYKAVHTWTGIVAGLALFIAFYAGALTVFEKPLSRWAQPSKQAQATPMEQGEALIDRTLETRADARKEFSLHVHPNGSVHMTWQKHRHDKTPWSATLTTDGVLEAVQTHRTELGKFIDTIHRTAGLPFHERLGTTIMGVISGLYVLALISGLILLLPTLIKDFFALRLGNKIKRMWLDTHNVAGIVSLPFHLVIALTAVVFGLHDQIYDTLDLAVYDGRLQTIMKSGSPFNSIEKDERPATMVPPAQLLAEIRKLEPGFTPRRMQYRNPGTQGAAVLVWGHDSRYLMRGKGFVVLSPVTGKVVSTEGMPGHQGLWSTVVSAFFALHFGSYGGDTVRWSYFFLGLAGAFVFYSGNLLWLESRRRNQRRLGNQEEQTPIVQRPAVRNMAAATVGVAVGCMAAISLTIVASKWLHGLAWDMDAVHRAVYYTVFLASIAWAFWRGAAKGAVDLLWFTAIATAAIPLTSLAFWLMPGTSSSNGLAVGVGAVALTASLCFAWMARATGQRVALGPVDSVWSGRA